MKRILITVICGCSIFFAAAQSTQIQKTGIDYVMRSNGRIYVVVAVMLLILTGLILYLLRIERKINKVEKEAV